MIRGVKGDGVIRHVDYRKVLLDRLRQATDDGKLMWTTNSDTRAEPDATAMHGRFHYVLRGRAMGPYRLLVKRSRSFSDSDEMLALLDAPSLQDDLEQLHEAVYRAVQGVTCKSILDGADFG